MIDQYKEELSKESFISVDFNLIHLLIGPLISNWAKNSKLEK